MDKLETIEQALFQQKDVQDFMNFTTKDRQIQSYYVQQDQNHSVKFHSFTLNSFQQTSIQRSLHTSTIISAPTASGKTLIACVLIESYMNARKSSYYLTPSKALAMEVFNFLTSIFGEHQIGYNCGTQQINQFAIVQVLTYEKFELLSYKQEVQNSLIVVDELHFIGAKQRGSVLERILIFNQENQFLGLSATLINSLELANWRQFQLLQFDPNSRKYNIKVHQNLDIKDVPIILNQISESGQNCIVFQQSRQKIVDLAYQYTKQFKLVEKIIGFDDERLQELSQFSIGFHSSNLSNNDKTIVESKFKEGKLKLIFSTTTLAYGVNLYAQNIIILNENRYQFQQNEVIQIMGRTGRDQDGNAYLINFDHEINFELAESQLLDQMVKFYLVCAHKNNDFIEYFKKTLFFYQNNISDEEIISLEKQIHQQLLKFNFIENKNLTKLGQIAVYNNYSPQFILSAVIALNTYQNNMYGFVQVIQELLPEYNIIYENQQSQFQEIIQQLPPPYHSKIGVLIKLSKREEVFNSFQQELELFSSEYSRICKNIYQISIFLNLGYWANLSITEYYQVQSQSENWLLKQPQIIKNLTLYQKIESKGQQQLLDLEFPELAEFQFVKAQIQPIHQNTYRLIFYVQTYKNCQFLLFSDTVLASGTVNSIRNEISFTLEKQNIFLSVFRKEVKQLISFNLNCFQTPKNTSLKSLKFDSFNELKQLILAQNEHKNNTFFILSDMLTEEEKIEISCLTNSSNERICADLSSLTTDYQLEIDLINSRYQLVFSCNLTNSDSLQIFRNAIILQQNQTDSTILKSLESVIDLRFEQIFQKNTQTNVNEFMDLLGRSFLVQRIQENPGYYGVGQLDAFGQGECEIGEEVISGHLTQIIEDLLEEGCFDLEGEVISKKVRV